MNLTDCSERRYVEAAQRREFNTNKDSVKVLDAFTDLKHVGNIADSEAQPLPPILPHMQTYPCAGAPLSDFSTQL
jgi:hypothetical protein